MKVKHMSINKIIVSILAGLALIGCDNRQKFHVYTWADYIDPDLLQQFEKDNNCRVVIDTFDSNETMLAKLMAGGTGYDVIMPTEYIMKALVDGDFIDKVDTNLLPNVVKNFDGKFASEWSLKYDVPYAFSCVGILWRKDKCPKDMQFNDWNDMFDSRINGRICMMDDIREVLGIALLMNGHSVNSVDTNELDEAASLAIKWKNAAAKMDNESYRHEIPAGDITVAMSYNSDAIQLLVENDSLGYVIPTNGTTASIDVLCIMKNSRNKELAHRFIDMFYVMSNTVKNAEYNGVPMPVTGLYDALSDDYKKIDVMRVTDELKAKCNDIKDLGDKIDIYAKAWDKVKKGSSK